MKIKRVLAWRLPGKIKLPDTFQAVKFLNFRYMLLGQLGHTAAVWMEQVVRPLLVIELTGSPAQVGLVVALRMLPQLFFGLLAGAVADRYNKRKILLFTQHVTLLTHLFLAVLLLMGRIKIWHVFLTAFIAGGSMAFNQPARQSLLPRLVPNDVLLNAIALNSAAINSMRILGASLAGVLLIFFDYSQVYLTNALLLLFVIWTTFKISYEEKGSKLGVSVVSAKYARHPSILHDLLEGFRYMLTNKNVLYLIGMAGILFIIVQPYQQVFVPLLALQVLNVGRSGAGWLLASVGVGALCGSLLIASLKHLPHRGLIMISCVVVFALMLLALAHVKITSLAVIILIIAGSVITIYNSLNLSLLIGQSPPEFHGRVLSLISLDRALVSIGAVFSGFLAEWLGLQWGLTIVALLCLCFISLVFVFVPAMRRMQ